MEINIGNTQSTLTDVATIAAAVAGGVSAIVAAIALIGIKRQTEAALFVTINEEWNKVYKDYRDVVVADVPMEEFKKHSDLDSFMNSPTWRSIRPVFAFYEFLGSCVEARLVSPGLLFKLVNVNYRLWEKYEPLITAMRKLGNYPDLYKRWQSLSERRKKAKV